jgi:hypothetical protein
MDFMTMELLVCLAHHLAKIAILQQIAQVVLILQIEKIIILIVYVNLDLLMF